MNSKWILYININKFAYELTFSKIAKLLPRIILKKWRTISDFSKYFGVNT